MITISKLGKLGAMGNQLFQYAALYGLYKKTGFEMRIPKPPKNVKGELKILGHTKDGHPLEEYDNCLDYFSISSKTYNPNQLIISEKTNNIFNKSKINKKYKLKNTYFEPHFNFDSQFFKIKDSTDIEGYFQSEKYFENCTEEIRNEFVIKEKYQKEAREKFQVICGKYTTMISAHIRRKGHENSENQQIHKYPEIEYYLRAINYFQSKIDNPQFLLFSDDIKWCKHKFQGTDVQFSTGNSSILDFAMMSLCDHNILTPSSFSWWASWLNKNPKKEVIGPRGKLFGPDGPAIIKDYFPGYILLI